MLYVWPSFLFWGVMAHISKYHDYGLVLLTIWNTPTIKGPESEETIVFYSIFPRYVSTLRNDLWEKPCTWLNFIS